MNVLHTAATQAKRRVAAERMVDGTRLGETTEGNRLPENVFDRVEVVKNPEGFS
jgi:hypothetical protein